jgi:hypothetical protein
MEKVRAHQRARLTNVKYDDVSSKLFYLKANGRKREKHIQFLQTEQGPFFKHEDKAKEIEIHFGEMFGTKQTRHVYLNWEALNYPTFDLADLEAEIIGEEVKAAISCIPKENAPGPDGFIGAFYHTCSDIVKGDVIAAVLQLSQLRGGTFNLLNTVNIVLLPKKEAMCTGDYKPISLVHNIAKIFSKILANRLAPKLSEMVSSS